MKELSKKAILYSGIGVTAVITAAFFTNLLAPQTRIGEGLRFFMPLLTGMVAGLILFTKLSGYNHEILEEIPEEEKET